MKYLRLLAVIALIVLVALPAQAQQAEWWNSSWHYRMQAWVYNNGIAREDWPIELNVNFTDVLKSAGCTEPCTFDEKSVRVVEYNNASGSLTVNTTIPSQFDPNFDYLANGTYNNSTNAVGTVVWILNGSADGSASRTFFVYFDTIEKIAERKLSGVLTNFTPNYSTNLSYNESGEEFNLSTGPLFVAVDTDRGNNTSGIYLLKDYINQSNDGGNDVLNVSKSPGNPHNQTAEYTRFFNNSSSEYTMFNLSGNVAIYSGPVRLVAELSGNETEWGNISNSTCNSCQGFLRKRYIFYNDLRWFKEEQIYTSLNPVTRGNDGEDLPGSLIPRAGALLFNLTDGYDTGVGNTELSSPTSEPMSVVCGARLSFGDQYRGIGIVNIEENLEVLRATRADLNPVWRGIGISLENTTIQNLRHTAAVTVDSDPFDEPDVFTTLCSNDPDTTFPGKIRNNFANDAFISVSSPELWNVSVKPETQFGGVDVDYFNRNETMNVTGLMVNDTHAMNSSMNATLQNSTGSETISLVRINDINFSRSYTFATNAAAGVWNVTLNTSDKNGLVVNQTNKNFTVTDIYPVNITNFSNVTNASSIPILINNTLFPFNLSVHNYRWLLGMSGGYGIAGLGASDISCTVTGPQPLLNVTNLTEPGGGEYALNFMTNSTLGVWNLSCSVNGTNTSGNAGSNATLFITEPPATSVTTNAAINWTLLAQNYYRVDNITQSLNNTTSASITLTNTGEGTAFSACINAFFGANISTNISFPYCGCGNVGSSQSCTLAFSITVKAATLAGNYTFNVTANWTNLENLLLGNHTYGTTSSNNSTINVTSNPIMSLDRTSAYLGSVHHNTSQFNASVFWLNNTGNNWLNNTTYTQDWGNLPGAWVQFAPGSGSNFSAGNNTSVSVTISIPKGQPNGTYESRFNISAADTYSYCASSNSLIDNCTQYINLSVYVPQNRSWITYENQSGSAALINNSTIEVTAGTAGTLGYINVSNEANFNLTFNLTDTEEVENMLTASVYNFTANRTGACAGCNDSKIVTLTYNVPAYANNTSNVSIRINASDAACPSCSTPHLINGTNYTYINFMLRFKDTTKPYFANATVDKPFIDANYENVTISADIIDAGNVNASKVWANVSLPNGNYVNLGMSLVSGTVKSGTWQVNYNTTPYGNNTSLFNIKIYANDTSDNQNNSSIIAPALNFSSVEIINKTRFLHESPNVDLTWYAANNTAVTVFYNVTQTNAPSFTLNITLYNDDNGSMRNVTLNVTNSAGIILNQTYPGNRTLNLTGNYSKLSAGGSNTTPILVTIPAGTQAGVYWINTTVSWTHPNWANSSWTWNISRTKIIVVSNPVVNVTWNNVSVDSLTNLTDNITLNIAHNSWNNTTFVVYSAGNDNLTKVNITCAGGVVCTDTANFTVLFDNNTDKNISTLLRGNTNTTWLNVSVAKGFPYGIYYGYITVNTTNTTCNSADKCNKTVNLTVVVPPDRNWTINTTYCSANPLKDSANGTVCDALITNTGNAILEVNVSLLSKNPINASNDVMQLKNNTTIINTTIAPQGSWSFRVNYTNTTLAENFTFVYGVNVTDNVTKVGAEPTDRNLTANTVVYSPPFINISLIPVIFDQGQTLSINVTYKDRSNVNVSWVSLNITGPNGSVADNRTLIWNASSPNCKWEPGNTTDGIFNIYYLTENYTVMYPYGNYSIVNVKYRDTSPRTDYNNSTGGTRNFTVRPKIILTATTSKTQGGAQITSFGPNDRVWFNVVARDINSDPLPNTNISINLTEPGGVTYFGSDISYPDGNSTDSNGMLKANYKLSGSMTGNWLWNITGNIAANSTSASNFTSGSFDVVTAELYLTTTVLGTTFKPGDGVYITVDAKYGNQTAIPDLTTNSNNYLYVFVYQPGNSTGYLNLSATWNSGPEWYTSSFTVDDSMPVNSSVPYIAKAVAKLGAEKKNDSAGFFITDSYTATMSMNGVQYTNTTLSASIVFYRATTGEMLDPETLNMTFEPSGNLTLGGSYVDSGAPWSKFKQENTGYFTFNHSIPSGQAIGNYLARLTATRKGISAYYNVPFQIVQKPADVSISAIDSTVSAGNVVHFTVKVTNPTESVNTEDLVVNYNIQEFPTRTGSLTVRLGAYETKYVAATLPTTASDTAGIYHVSLSWSGAGFIPGSIAQAASFALQSGGVAPPGPGGVPAAGPGGGGGGGGGMLIYAAEQPTEAQQPKISLEAPSEINVVRGWVVSTTVSAKNAGGQSLSNLQFTIGGIPESWWNASVIEGNEFSLAVNGSATYFVSFSAAHDAQIKAYPITIKVTSGNTTDTYTSMLRVYGSWGELVPDALTRLNATLSELVTSTDSAQKGGTNVTDLTAILGEAKSSLDTAKNYYITGEYSSATLALDKARLLLDRANVLLATRMAAPAPQPVPVAPLMVTIGIVGALAAIALATAAWTGRTTRRISTTASSFAFSTSPGDMETRRAPRRLELKLKPSAEQPPPRAAPKIEIPKMEIKPPTGSAPASTPTPMPRIETTGTTQTQSIRDKLEKSRQKTEELLNSLREQQDKGVLSKDKYDEIVKKIKK
jgi:hypothetical protein